MQMLNKIFLLILGISVIAMSVLTFFSFTWLQSVDKPANVAANFEFYSGLALTFLWISSLVMLILSNALLWINRSMWELWTTFLYFAVFVLLNIFWLSELFFAFKKANGLNEGAFSLTGIFGAVLCVVVGVGVFFDQFIVTKLRDKTNGMPVEPVVEDSQVIEAETDQTS